MGILWLVKLWWMWVIVGLVFLIPSVLPPGISILGTIIGGIFVFWGVLARKVMQSDTIKNRIERNL